MLHGVAVVYSYIRIGNTDKMCNRKRVYDTRIVIKLPRANNGKIQAYLNVKYHRMYLDYVSDNMLNESRAGREILFNHFGTKNEQVILDKLVYISSVKSGESMSGICKQIIKTFLDEAKFKKVLSK